MKPEQITAWALDEASAEERLQLEAELRENPMAQKGAEETKAFCDFLLDELRDESLALTDEQRARLEAGPEPSDAAVLPRRKDARKEVQKRQPLWRAGLLVRAAVAACLVLGGFWMWQEHGRRSRRDEMQVAEAVEARYKVLPAQAAAPRDQASATIPIAADEVRKAAPVDGLVASLPLMPPPATEPLQTPVIAGKELTSPLPPLTTGDMSRLKNLQDQTAYGIVGEVAGSTTMPGNMSSVQAPSPTLFHGSVLPGASAGQPASSTPGGYTGASSAPATQLVAGVPGSSLPAALPPPPGATVMGDALVTAAANPTPLVADPMPDADYYARADGAVSGRRAEPEKMQQNMPRQPSNESYQRIVENELKDVAREPLSTFSIDVDTAAYANVRRFLNQNMIPPADAVRIEELVNYFPAAEEGPAPGSKEPFAVRVEMAPCPWQPAHRLARIAIKGREIGNERKASNLVFLVDVSGSMDEPSKLPLVQQSLRMLAEQLREEDRVTMVVYAGSSGLVLPPTNGDNKAEILAAIDKLKAGGSTHGSAGIQLAYEQAVAGFIKEGVNRVVLCTDGDFNVGVSSPAELEKLITKKAKSGVFLSVLGFGTGNLKDHTMETLADKGNGNYFYIDSLSEARKVLVEQMSGTLVTIAKDVKIQVEFNPAVVRSYRLIGYENRLLAKEDFNDDTKDAGEIGAGHSVVALYEMVPANLPPGAESRPAVDGLRYQQVPATPAPVQLAEAAKTGEVMTVKLRYKEPDSSLSKLIERPATDEGKTLTASTEEFKFSAAVAGFGLLLRDSSYKGALSWETVRRLALDGKGADKMGHRGEFLQLIDKARGLKETRP